MFFCVGRYLSVTVMGDRRLIAVPSTPDVTARPARLSCTHSALPSGQLMLARRLALPIALIAGLIGSQAPSLLSSTASAWAARFKSSSGLWRSSTPRSRRRTSPRPRAWTGSSTTPTPWPANAAMTWRKQSPGRPARGATAGDGCRWPLTRVAVLARNFDPQIAQSTLDSYQPAAPLSLGALTAAGLAALLGWRQRILRMAAPPPFGALEVAGASQAARNQLKSRRACPSVSAAR